MALMEMESCQLSAQRTEPIKGATRNAQTHQDGGRKGMCVQWDDSEEPQQDRLSFNFWWGTDVVDTGRVPKHIGMRSGKLCRRSVTLADKVEW